MNMEIDRMHCGFGRFCLVRLIAASVAVALGIMCPAHGDAAAGAGMPVLPAEVSLPARVPPSADVTSVNTDAPAGALADEARQAGTPPAANTALTAEARAGTAAAPGAKTAPGMFPEVTGEYRIHTGDWLIISIPYEVDTRMEVPVRPDGRITYLFNIELMAAGLTYRELNTSLLTELSKYYKAPAVNVVAKSFAGNAVYVMGPVQRPGAHTIQNDSRLLEVLSSAGVLSVVPQIPGDESYSSPVRDVVDLKGAYIARGDRILEVDFEELLLKGDMRQNIPLQPKDFIFIPSSYLTKYQKRIYVCGSVSNPRVYRYTGEATLVEAVAEAGGPINNVASERGCYLIRRSNKSPLRVNYLAMVRGRESDIHMEDGDIIYFPERSLHYGSKVATTVISEILAPLQSVIDADNMAKRYQQREWGGKAPIQP